MAQHPGYEYLAGLGLAPGWPNRALGPADRAGPTRPAEPGAAAASSLRVTRRAKIEHPSVSTPCARPVHNPSPAVHNPVDNSTSSVDERPLSVDRRPPSVDTPNHQM